MQLLDEELLRKLIAILESGDPDLLDTMIDPVALPGVTYGDVLRKLKDFQYSGEPIRSERGERLDAAMADWATMNDSERFDQKLRDLVKFLAGILAHLLFMDWKKIDMYGEGEEDLASSRSGTEFSDVLSGAFDIARSEIPEPTEYSNIIDGAFRGEDDDAVYIEIPQIVVDEVSERATANEMFAGSMTRSESSLADDMMEGGVDVTDGGLIDISSLEGEEAAALEGEALLEEGYAAEAMEGAEEAKAMLTPEEERLRAEAEAAAAAQRAAAEREAAEQRGVIFGHKPSRVFEHTPDGICCVSLKIYALWLYEVAENAHNWSSWLIEVIQEVRNYTRIVKGEVRNPDGTKRVLKKDEWRKFVEKIEKMIVSWRQYSQHIESLSDRLMKTIHDKKVTCCPKCLSDNLIKDLAAANCLTEELTEAITTATYWRQWLDNMIDQTKRLTTIPVCKYAQYFPKHLKC